MPLELLGILAGLSVLFGVIAVFTGFSIPKPKTCPECQTPDSFTSIGPGVERIAVCPRRVP